MNEAQEHIYEFGDFRIDAAKRLLLKCDGERVSLTPKAFDTLLYLVQHSGTLLDKDELLRAVWGDTIVEENNLNQHISTLRRVLGEKRDEHQYIMTVPGRGYRFIADVSTHTNVNEQKRVEKNQPALGQKQATESNTDAASQLAKRAGEQNRYVWIGLLAALVMIGLIVAAFYFWRARTKTSSVPSIRTIAVLPFKPLVAENRDEALEMGMADTLIARLSNSREIIVRPLSSVRRYRGLEQDPQAAGRALGVESVLDGSIQRWGDRIRVNARLVSVSDGASLWSETFDEKFTDVFAVQDTISERVTGALALRLSSEEKRRLTKRYTENTEAYQLYLIGRFHWGRLTPPEIGKSIEYFQQAIEIDPAYALAYGGLAKAYTSLPITSDVPPTDAFPKAKAAALKALEIDESLDDVHATLGIVKCWFDWDWSGAQRECERAVDLNPNSGEAHRACALLLFYLGRHDEAITEGKRARELDPLSLITNLNEGMFLHYAGRDDEAVARLRKTLELDPNFWIARLTLAKVYTRRRMYPEAIAELSKARELSGGNTETISLIGYAWALSGNRAQAQTTLDELISLSTRRYVPPYNIAMVYNGLDEKDEALAWLEKAYEERDVRLTFIKIDPKWDSFRSDSRFAAIIKRIGLE
ncbi:MAG: winged helix-turn-helix domain-containing protein [Pyrinomonadaceae bacterium]|nr:winged helix-turn-helix domain-containing protein [Pyrinomonadaceae bacterium]